MNETKSGGSKLVLLELVFSVFMFTLITAVCIQIFSKAHQTTERSSELTESVNLCTSAAELFRTNANDDAWFAAFPTGDVSERGLDVNFDEKFIPVNTSSAYKLHAEFTNKDGYDIAEISMIRISDFETVYTLKVEKLSNE